MNTNTGGSSVVLPYSASALEFLEDFDGEEEEEDQDEKTVQSSSRKGQQSMHDQDSDVDDDGGGRGGRNDQLQRTRTERDDIIPSLKLDDVEKVTTLLTDGQVQKFLVEIGEFEKETMQSLAPLVYAFREYDLIIKGNELLFSMLKAISKIHKFIKINYNKRYPELETLVPAAVDYARVVKRIQNAKDFSKVELDDILSQATKMVVSLKTATEDGEVLTEEELARVLKACDGLLSLFADQQKIFDFVQSRMSRVAPNLTVLVGPGTAAHLMAAAGGLKQLAGCPANVIQILGKETKLAQLTSLGMIGGFAATVRHVGYIYDSDLVQMCPPDLRKMMIRVLSAKAVLAARCDAFETQQDPTLVLESLSDITTEKIPGSTGMQMLDELKKKLDKWQEPPPIKKVKALPRPDDQPKKKRGGKRFRKLKERNAMTQTRKLQNRVAFDVAPDDVIDAEDLGMLNQKDASGVFHRLRLQAMTKKVTRKNARNLAIGGSNNSGTSGTATSMIQTSKVTGMTTAARAFTTGTATGFTTAVTFTAAQGLELAAPAPVSQQSAPSRYFSSNVSFSKK